MFNSDSTEQHKQQQPPVETMQQSYNASQHDSIDHVISVLVMIIVLGIIIVKIQRLCSGRRITSRGKYDNFLILEIFVIN